MDIDGGFYPFFLKVLATEITRASIVFYSYCVSVTLPTGFLLFTKRPGDLLRGCKTLERHSVCSHPQLARAGEGGGAKSYQYLHWADWRSPQSYHGKKKRKNTEITYWKPECQTVWPSCVQGAISCPGHCFQPKLQLGEEILSHHNYNLYGNLKHHNGASQTFRVAALHLKDHNYGQKGERKRAGA